MRLLIIAAVVGLAHPSYALPPTEHGRGFRDGANHHLGDDSFVAKFGRLPGPRDSEHTRMTVHLAYVRDMLAARPATRPELALRRTQILSYLDEYIAADIEPQNTYVPWRSPVFIDRDGKICAVGYLIERTAGHELVDAIARTHRLDYLEDIATAMPEVSRWIATSGLTLTELASIQPGYNGPEVQFLDGFDETQLVDGDFAVDGVAGTISRHNMVGHWTASRDGVVVGSGDFARGAGTWTSFYPDGKARLATGTFAHNRAEGTWQMFHPSGHLAARGTFHKGKRDGGWQFFYDTADETPISAGTFDAGYVAGTWRHFDRQGKLLAKASHAPKRSGGEWINDGLFLSITAGSDGVIHEMHGGIPATSARLDGYYSGSERLYVDENDAIWDADGNQLTQTDGTWYAAACSWSAKRKRAAHAGDIVTVHVMMLEDGSSNHDEDTCGNPRPVGPVRDRRIDRTLAARTAVRAPAPAFVSETAEANVAYQYPMNKADLASVLAGNMAWYMEWPFIDGKFREVFATLPGY